MGADGVGCIEGAAEAEFVDLPGVCGFGLPDGGGDVGLDVEIETDVEIEGWIVAMGADVGAHEEGFVIEPAGEGAAPKAEGIDAIKVFVVLDTVLEVGDVGGIEKGILAIGGGDEVDIGVGGLGLGGAETGAEPVLFVDGIEGESELFIAWGCAAHTELELVEVVGFELGGFFDPDGADALDGFDFLGIVEPMEEDLAAILKGEGAVVALIGDEVCGVKIGDGLGELGMDAMAQGGGDFADDELAKAGGGEGAEDSFGGGGEAFAAAGAAKEDGIAGLATDEGEECREGVDLGGHAGLGVEVWLQ